MNRGINNASKHPITPNRRPDVTVLKKDGKIHKIEVPSKTDKISTLNECMEDANSRLLAHQRVEFKAINITQEV